MKLIIEKKLILILIVIVSNIFVNCITRKLKALDPCDYGKAAIDKVIKGDPFSPTGCESRIKQQMQETTSYITEGLLYKEKMYSPTDLNKYYMKNDPIRDFQPEFCSKPYGKWVDDYETNNNGAVNPQVMTVSYYIKDCDFLSRVWKDYQKFFTRAKISACVSGFMKATPPPFCWKRVFQNQKCGYMKDCGPLACAQNSGTCASAVSLMVMKSAKFAVDLTTKIMTGGLVWSIGDIFKGVFTDEAKEYAAAFAMYTVQSAFESMEQKPERVKKFKQRMLDEAQLIYKTTNKEICDKVYEQMKPKKGSFDEAKSFLTKMKQYVTQAKWDPSGVSGIKTDCSENDPLTCIKSIIGIASPLDITGVVSLATAFIYPICEKEISK